jgi:hypothetical protein
MGADWGTEALERHFAQVFELKSLADAEFGNGARYQDLFGLHVRAKPGGQLHCRSKEIVILLDGFPCSGADSDLERAVRIRLLMPG